MDENEFNQVLMRYYRAPDPSVAAEALSWFASSRYAFDPNTRRPVQYFFSRLLELHPEQRDAVSRVRSRVSPGQPPVIDEVLAATRAPDSIPNAIDMPVAAPQVNDLLWCEFSLTGDRRAVERLIEVLGQPDRVRERLEPWLRSRSLTPAILRPFQRRKCARLCAELGIEIDPVRLTLTTPADLDCRCFLNGLELDRSRSQRARSLLPFRLSIEDQLYIAVKATAKWSLASRACDDREVRVICEDVIDRLDRRVQLSLIEIVAVACAAQQDNDAALDLATRYLSLDPGNELMSCLKADIGSRIELDMLAGLPTPDPGAPLVDAAGTSRQCINATKNASSYSTRCTLRSTNISGEESRIEWNMEYSKPNRYHVTQEAQPSEDYDEWIAVGNHVWRQPLWFHRSGTDSTIGEHWLDMMLSAAPYLELLEKMRHCSGFSADIGSRRFAVLQYIVDANEKKVPSLLADEKRKYQIWVDPETGLLRRVEVESQNDGPNTDQIYGRHVYAGYDQLIRIDPPSTSVERVLS